MMNRAGVERIKAQYKPGTKVELIYMDDIQAPPSGTKGTVSVVDDRGKNMLPTHIKNALDLLDRVPEEEWNTMQNPIHGKLVRVRQAAYHDIYEYEDGYEERFYIGD